MERNQEIQHFQQLFLSVITFYCFWYKSATMMQSQKKYCANSTHSITPISLLDTLKFSAKAN